LGYRVSFVPFTPVKREQGKSKYRPATLLNFALNGICSFSKVPLRFCIGAGFILATLSLLGALVQVLMYATGSVDVPGWASLIAMVSFGSGVQLFSWAFWANTSALFSKSKTVPRICSTDGIPQCQGAARRCR
jgi:dolichol-phosphate mannosyltransferase